MISVPTVSKDNTSQALYIATLIWVRTWLALNALPKRLLVFFELVAPFASTYMDTIPNGTPLVYELDKDLKPIRHYYLEEGAVA